MSHKQSATPSSVAPQPETLTEKILKQAVALGAKIKKVFSSPEELVLQVGQMLGMRGDVQDLVSRGFAVTLDAFDRIEAMANLLMPNVTKQMKLLEDRNLHVDFATQLGQQFFVIRQEFVRLVKAAGLSSKQLSIVSRRADVLPTSMRTIVSYIETIRTQLADQKMVDDLISQANALIAQYEQARSDAKVANQQSLLTTQTVMQLKRMLFDELHVLSKQGLAAYPNDSARQKAYGLGLLRHHHAKKVAATETVAAPVAVKPPVAS